MSTIPKIETICGVEHCFVPDDTIDYHEAERVIKHVHPNGDIYVVGEHGYVAVGMEWLQFPMSSLEQIRATD